ncbi:MAG: hypothetical protein U0Y10_13280 [Spirosomataceae bacterium]
MLIIFLFCSNSLLVSAQNITFSLSPDPALLCPGTTYRLALQFNNNTSSQGCRYDWSVTNGIFANNSTTITNSPVPFVDVIPSDKNDNLKVTVVFKSCTTPALNTTYTFERRIRSLYDITPSMVFYPNNNSTLPINLCTQQVFDPTIQPVNVYNSNNTILYSAESYEWTPANWIISGDPTSNSVLMRNPFCSPNTTVRVRAKLQCDNTTSYSNYANLLVTRPNLPSGINGANSIPQGSTAPVTYSISVSCATTPNQYQWTLPTGWTGQTQGSSISVTPNSCSGGTLSVSIACSGGGTLNYSLSITRPVFDPNLSPTIVGSDVLCSGTQTYSIANIPPGSISYSWSASSQFTPQSGNTNPSYTVGLYQSGNGQINVNLYNSCGTQISRTKYIRVGQYQPSEMTISGSSSLCLNQQYAFYCPFLSSTSSDYNWQVSPSSSFNAYSSSNAFFLTPINTGYSTITLRVQNACGWPSVPATYFISQNSCYGYRFISSPNPTIDKLSVAATVVDEKGNEIDRKMADTYPEFSYKLLNEQGITLLEGASVKLNASLDLKKLSKGIYYLHLNDGKTITKQRIGKE